MALAHPAQIQPEVLEWAIERVDISVPDLAKAAGTSEAIVQRWIDGEALPTFIQARKAAKKLRLPFGALFLDEPPTETLPIADFRTVDGSEVQEPSPELRDVLYSVLRRKDWLTEYLEAVGADPVRMVGSAADPESVPELARQLNDYLRLGADFVRPTNAADFLRELVRRTEDLGVNVARNGIVGNNTHRPLNVEEFRGFAVSDPIAPFIFINGADSPAAQVFTLVHELTHILRGDSGISASGISHVSSVETICNRVAAEVLVPAQEFRSFWPDDKPLKEAIEVSAKRFRVSRYVIAIRAYESNLIDQAELDQLLVRFRDTYKNRKKGDGGDFYRTLVTRNGRTLTRRVLDALRQQHVLTRDAASLLDAKVGQLARVDQEIRSA